MFDAILQSFLAYAVADLVNATFTLIGGTLLFSHTRAAIRAGGVSGVHWAPFGFYWLWTIYGCWYYPHIHQPATGYANWLPVFSYAVFFITWAVLALKRRRT